MTTSSIALSQEGCKKAIEIALKANTPIILTGSVGIGKSEIIKQIAEDYQLEVIDIRLSQVSQYDLLGLPKEINGRMEYVPMDTIPLSTDPIPQGKQGFILFLDEINSADKYTQGAA